MSFQAIKVEIDYIFKGFNSIHDVRRKQLVAMTIDVLLGDGSHRSRRLFTSLNCVVKEAGGGGEGVVMEEKGTRIQNNTTNHHGNIVFYLATLFKALILSCFVLIFFQMTQSGIFSQK